MQPGKYARVERERRFLVDALPDLVPTADRQITDLYLEGTRLRLRLSVGVVAGAPETVRKLTQKIPAPAGSPPGVQGWITNTYLSAEEYERLAVLPGRWLRKRRLSIAPMGVDVFEGAVAGLILAEAEFTSDAEMATFVPPPWCGREVTGDAAFTGGQLALRG